MIKILHIYPKGEGLTARYVRLLTEYASAKVEQRIVEHSPEAQLMCKEWQPDIVHCYGAATVNGDGFRIVVSPCGQKVPTPRNQIFISRSNYEAQRLKQQGAIHVETILNPLITKTVDFAVAAKKTLAVYQKLMDSAPLEMMNDATCRLLALALKAAIHGDRRWAGDTSDIYNNIDFRRLYIYATLEGVLALAQKGLQLLNIDAPGYEKSDSYVPYNYHHPEPMTFKSLYELITDIEVHGPSLLRLAEIHQSLINPCLNEDMLCKQFEEKGLMPLFCSTLQLLTEQTLLDEGFCPCQPVNNGYTDRLRTKLLNHLKL